MPILTAEKVEDIFRECLSDDVTDGVIVEGVVRKAALDKAKLAVHRAAIAELLRQLPEAFLPVDRAGGGGGWSFLQACVDRDGNQWTGLHRTMEELFMLGIGTDQARFVMPREMWDILPGGMPYVQVNPDDAECDA